MAKRIIKPSFDLFSGYSYYVPGTGGMFMLLAMFLLGAIIGNIVVMLLSPLIGTEYLTLVSYPIMFVPPMLYASYQSRKNALFDTGYALDNNNFGAFSGFSIALAVSIATLASLFVLDIVQKILPPMPAYLEQILETLLNGPVWVSVLSLSIFAPFFEEWLCRGMVLRGLLQKMNPAGAIVISALFFALIHMNPWQAIPAFAIGLLLGFVYYKTGSLKLTMLMHCVNNTAAIITGKIFVGENSFFDVMPLPTYILIYVLCVAMIVLFFFRMRAVSIPSGQRNGCKVLEN